MSARRLTPQAGGAGPESPPSDQKEFRPWLALFTKLRSSLHFRIPQGYQDQTGFHLGPTVELPDTLRAQGAELREW